MYFRYFFENFTVLGDHHDGVPFFCKHWICPLNHENVLFNQNKYMKALGDIGYPYFDVNRKFFFGVASFVTFLSMIVTTYGCFALSTDRSVIQRTYWTGGSGHNVTSGKNFAVYIGLRSVEFVDCDFTAGYNSYEKYCDRRAVQWTDDGCSSGLIGEACAACESTATTMWSTAFFSCAGLILSFLGAQTRMRIVGDVPVQKLVGMGSETWNVITLSIALYVFHHTCYVKLNSAFNSGGLESRMWSGPGYICYWVCAFSAGVRAVIHWLTPLPNKGSGFCSCKEQDIQNCASSSSVSTPLHDAKAIENSLTGVKLDL